MDEQKLAALAQEIRDNLYARGMPVGPGPNREAALKAMSAYLAENGYVFSHRTAEEQTKHDLAVTIRTGVEIFKRSIEGYGPTLELVATDRRHTGEIREALKWVAAFSTAALFLTGQLVHRPSSVELMPLSDTKGLVVGACAFLLSIVGAGIFLLRVDLAASEWLRRVVARVALDLQAYRAALRDYGEAEVALAENDQQGVVTALKHAGVPIQELQGRGSLPLGPAFTRTERVSLVLCIGGFALGVLSVVGDFVAKMPR